MENVLYPANILVKETHREDGQYPKLKITDINGKVFSISDKHQALWPIFEGAIGKTVMVAWKTPPPNAQWKAFIEKAQVMITAANMQQPVQPVPAQPVQAKTTAPVTAVAQNVATYSRESSIECQVAFKGIVELIDAGKIPIDSKLGMRAQAWALLAFDVVLPKTTIEMIDSRIEATKEAAKPKVKAEPK